jgi:NAD(P)-dependent dehydrogenase (short-subunit alcohol dehydrogenase family)
MVKTQLNQNVWAASQAALPADQRQSYDDWAEGKIRKVSPLGRWQELPEFAAMATFLASDHAKNITGQTLNIDGGQIMHS